MDSYYPNKNIIECNYELSQAISQALMILGYYELPENEQPDESIWSHPEKLEDWWESVKRNRETPGMEKIDNDYSGDDFMSNQLAEDFKEGLK